MAPDEIKEYEEAFRFGTLVHSLILEHHTVDMFGATYSQEELQTAKKMRTAFRADPFCMQLFNSSQKEVEMYNEGTGFSYNGIAFTLDTRRKYDLWSPVVGWGADVKSTTATSQSAFEAAIDRFDYDRARVFYAKGPMAMRDVIIGISKKNFKVFKVFMKHGDPMWTRGEEKVNELAFKKYMICETA